MDCNLSFRLDRLDEVLQTLVGHQIPELQRLCPLGFGCLDSVDTNMVIAALATIAGPLNRLEHIHLNVPVDDRSTAIAIKKLAVQELAHSDDVDTADAAVWHVYRNLHALLRGEELSLPFRLDSLNFRISRVLHAAAQDTSEEVYDELLRKAFAINDEAINAVNRPMIGWLPRNQAQYDLALGNLRDDDEYEAAVHRVLRSRYQEDGNLYREDAEIRAIAHQARRQRRRVRKAWRVILQAYGLPGEAEVRVKSPKDFLPWLGNEDKVKVLVVSNGTENSFSAHVETKRPVPLDDQPFEEIARQLAEAIMGD